MHYLIFGLIFLLVFGLMNLYSYKRFIKKLFLLNPYKRLLSFLLALLFAFQVSYLFSFRLDFLPQSVLYLLSISIGLGFMLFCTALVYDAFVLLRHSKKPANMQRRKAIKIIFDIASLVFLLGYLFGGIAGGLRPPRLKRVKIRLKNLQENLRIIQLSDVHIGNATGKDFVEGIVRRINALNPDMVVITGDLIDNTPDKIYSDARGLQNLRSKYGTYFCFGNHEYFHNASAIGKMLENLGIKVLEDESVKVAGLNLVGLRDLVAKRFGYKYEPLKAFKNIDPSLPTIVLSHQPKQIKEFEQFAPELVLSGHTHGGQIFPFGLLVKLDQPYLSGLHQHNEKTQIYVSNGTGFWGPPIRFLAPSEITVIELSKENA